MTLNHAAALDHAAHVVYRQHTGLRGRPWSEMSDLAKAPYLEMARRVVNAYVAHKAIARAVQ